METSIKECIQKLSISKIEVQRDAKQDKRGSVPTINNRIDCFHFLHIIKYLDINSFLCLSLSCRKFHSFLHSPFAYSSINSDVEIKQKNFKNKQAKKKNGLDLFKNNNKTLSKPEANQSQSGGGIFGKFFGSILSSTISTIAPSAAKPVETRSGLTKDVNGKMIIFGNTIEEIKEKLEIWQEILEEKLNYFTRCKSLEEHRKRVAEMKKQNADKVEIMFKTDLADLTINKKISKEEESQIVSIRNKLLKNQNEELNLKKMNLEAELNKLINLIDETEDSTMQYSKDLIRISFQIENSIMKNDDSFNFDTAATKQTQDRSKDIDKACKLEMLDSFDPLLCVKQSNQKTDNLNKK